MPSAEAAGPVFVGGFETITVGSGNERYSILFLPDKHNDELQRQGKPPVYYWMPGQVRMARKGDTGDYKFHLIHFVGVQSSDTNVGVDGTREVAGGVFSVTTTAAYPLDIMQKAQEELLNRFRGKDTRYWGWHTPAAPMFRGMPIVSNITAMTNLSPNSNGSIPNAGVGSADGSGTVPTPGGAPGGAGGAAPASGGPPRSIGLEAISRMPRTVPYGRNFRAPANLDAWFWNLQGQGPGSINLNGENAFSGLIGSLPAAILWQGFHGAYSPIAITQAMKLKVWSQTLRIKIRGNWDRIFEHFSANVKGRAFWFSADIKVEFNNLRINGGIEVELEIDGTLPTADKLREEANKRIDLILNKFMDEANKRIFEPAPPNVEPAQANDGGWPWGAGVALKYRRDSTKLELSYDEVVSEQYLQDHVISSALEGFYDEIKRDPAAERKYFTTLYLDDWDRKVTRIVKPVVNWSDPSRKWVGEPVSFLSVQIGYPSARGDVQWAAHIFQNTDTGDTTRWQPSFAKKNATDVVDAPAQWTPDKTFVKRRVHFLEPPGETDSPYMRVFVEKNIVDLDPEPNGSLTNDNTIEVRADSAGKLAVGPFSLNVELENSREVIEVELKADGNTADGRERGVTKFIFKFEDQEEPRYWGIFTGQLDYIPSFKCRVHVVVKGSLFSKGMEWWGPWETRAGNGPLVISVPTPDAEGATRRALLQEEISSPAPIPTAPSAATPPSGPTAGTAPPAAPSPVTLPPAPRFEPAEVGVAGWTLEPPSGGRFATSSPPPLPLSQPRFGSGEEGRSRYGSTDRGITPSPSDLVLDPGWREDTSQR